MRVDVISCVNEAKSEDFMHKTAIVIDALRATSTIITALAHGCKEVIPVETVQQAKACQQAEDWLGGERYCKKIAGFQYGNSPLEYMSASIRAHRVILTTTNGTRAIQKSTRATTILAGAIINASACAAVALRLNKDIVLLCAGAQDEFALEDGLCAGLIIEELMRQANASQPIHLNDLGFVMHAAYLQHQDSLLQVIQQCEGGRKLSKLGFHEDIIYCANVNSVPVVPILNANHTMTLYAVQAPELNRQC